jgi:hypothetical protein
MREQSWPAGPNGLKKGGRRWAAAGLEKEGGGQAETISWAEFK